MLDQERPFPCSTGNIRANWAGRVEAIDAPLSCDTALSQPAVIAQVTRLAPSSSNPSDQLMINRIITPQPSRIVQTEIRNRSLTASLKFCLHPMQLSVVWTDA
jgi:hypothetical protein